MEPHSSGSSLESSSHFDDEDEEGSPVEHVPKYQHTCKLRVREHEEKHGHHRAGKNHDWWKDSQDWEEISLHPELLEDAADNGGERVGGGALSSVGKAMSALFRPVKNLFTRSWKRNGAAAEASNSKDVGNESGGSKASAEDKDGEVVQHLAAATCPLSMVLAVKEESEVDPERREDGAHSPPDCCQRSKIPIKHPSDDEDSQYSLASSSIKLLECSHSSDEGPMTKSTHDLICRSKKTLDKPGWLNGWKLFAVPSQKSPTRLSISEESLDQPVVMKRRLASYDPHHKTAAHTWFSKEDEEDLPKVISDSPAVTRNPIPALFYRSGTLDTMKDEEQSQRFPERKAIGKSVIKRRQAAYDPHRKNDVREWFVSKSREAIPGDNASSLPATSTKPRQFLNIDNASLSSVASQKNEGNEEQDVKGKADDKSSGQISKESPKTFESWDNKATEQPLRARQFASYCPDHPNDAETWFASDDWQKKGEELSEAPEGQALAAPIPLKCYRDVDSQDNQGKEEKDETKQVTEDEVKVSSSQAAPPTSEFFRTSTRERKVYKMNRKSRQSFDFDEAN